MDRQLEEKLLTLPAAPGVYLMKDRAGEVIYVGKAVSLRSRVRSYFNRNQDLRAFVSLLDRILADIEVVVVGNEKEALLLENELIKRHHPRFNVQLRDDKNFICLRLDVQHPYPRLEIVRRFKNDGARYFGPYASASSIRETIRIVNRFFQLRTCSDHVLKNRRRPCLLYQIGRCAAPCVFPIPPEEYRRGVDEVILFLEGRAGELLEGLKARIAAASEALVFEEAARLRDQLYAVERSLERQKVALDEPVDQDVFGLHREADRLLIYVLYVRRGRIAGGQSFGFSGQEFPDEELLSSFVNLYYDQGNFVPKEVLLPISPEGPLALEELLTEKKGERVYVQVPRRGKKRELVEMSNQNAEHAFHEKKRSKEELQAILLRLKERLHLSRVPHRIECYDVSHFQGSAIVASQVASVDGELDKARYRRFRIKTLLSQDDFASIYEVISRRVARGKQEGDLPDLIVIDGGKGQLQSADAALRDAGVEGLEVVGLAKSRDLGADEKSPERIFLRHRKDPVVLGQSSPELFLLTQLRDEAHRFAITFQQRLLRKKNLRSELDEVPGVGEVRRGALLRHFGSVKGIKEATIEQLAEVEGLGPAVAERIHAHLHGAPLASEEDDVRESSLADASVAEVGQRRSPGGP